jgi:Zn-dependent protease
MPIDGDSGALVSGWWVHNLYEQGGAALVASWVIWVIGSIVLHELAHGWAALWQGDETPRELDRMTINPMVHMGPWALLMFAVIGITWGMMPTDPSRYRWGRRGRVVVAAAGPAMNLLLAFVALTALGLSGLSLAEGETAERMAQFLLIGGFLNIALAMFNLLPAPPLDGSGILAGLSWKWYQWSQDPRIAMYSLLALMVLFFIGGLGGVLFGTAMGISSGYAGFLTRLVWGSGPEAAAPEAF